MSSATDELRRLLDERGVEWEAPMSFDGTARYDTTACGYWFHEFNGKITIHGLTPEQAIAATLGPRTCRKLPSSGETRCFVSRYGCEMEFGYWKCSNCGVECFDGAKYCMNCGSKAVENCGAEGGGLWVTRLTS